MLGDEFDELRDPSVTGTTTYLWDVSDLGSPTLVGTHVSTATRAIDHNQFVKGKYTYQSNYQAGLRILDVTDIANGNLTEVAFFDMVPDADSPQSLEGTWGNYPFFDSGIVIVSVRTQGLFILRPNLVDRIQPKVGRATVDRETLTLTYGEALDETSEPALDAFAVTVEGTERSVSGVSVSGRAVTLTLSSAVTVAQEVTVTYTVPGTNPTRDEAENNAPSLSSREVRNDTTGPPGTPTAPTVTAASATSLTVIWAEPPNAKPPITDYDVQYRVGSSGNFTDWPARRDRPDSDNPQPDRGHDLPGAGAGEESRRGERLVDFRQRHARAPAQHRTDGVGDGYHANHRERPRQGHAGREGDRPRWRRHDLRLDQLRRWDLR